MLLANWNKNAQHSEEDEQLVSNEWRMDTFWRFPAHDDREWLCAISGESDELEVINIPGTRIYPDTVHNAQIVD